MIRWIAVLVVMVSSPAFAQRISPTDETSVCATARTQAALSDKGPWLAKHASQGQTLEVYKNTGDRLQILEEVSGAYLVLQVERSTLCTAALDGAKLFPSTAAAGRPFDPMTPGMMLQPGTPIDSATPAANSLTKVRLRGPLDREVQITGYVATSKIGTVFGRGGRNWSRTADVWLPPRFRLLDAPGGTAFVVSTSPKRAVAHAIRRDGAFTLVQIADGAVGWIASSQLAPIPASEQTSFGRWIMPRIRQCEFGHAPGAIDGCVSDPQNTMREGAPLFDAIGGQLVGSVTSYFRYKPVRTDHGWHRYDLPTRFGTVGLWTQPNDPPRTPTPASAPNDIGGGANGVEGGEQGGVEGGDLNGVVAAPPPPPSRRPPRTLSPTTFKANLISGETRVDPDSVTVAAMKQAGESRIVAFYKVCIDERGFVDEVLAIVPTGFRTYDRTITKAISQWVFRPFLTNGVPEPVCGPVTFDIDVDGKEPPAAANSGAPEVKR